MMSWMMLFCYCIVAYGACNVIVFGEGPGGIFSKLREFAFGLGPRWGTLFSCMMCMPTNFGIIASLVDWFLIPGVAFTPFNMLLPAAPWMWIFAMLCDGAFTTGIVWIIHNVESLFEKYSEKLESESVYQEEIEDDNIEVDDITRK